MTNTGGINTMVIGVISDTHGSLSSRAYRALEGVDAIIHAGDIGPASVLLELQTIAPVVAVLGNCDRPIFGPSVGPVASPRYCGARFKVAHQPMNTGYLEPGTVAVINGHTHRAKVEEIDGVFYINPGSAKDPRGEIGPSIAKIGICDGRIETVEIVEI